MALPCRSGRPVQVALKMAAVLACAVLSACAGPLVAGGGVYFGRAFVLQAVAPPVEDSLEGLPIKEARLYRVRAYLVEGECPLVRQNVRDAADPLKAGDCEVRAIDLGVVPLQAGESFLQFRYRGGDIMPATVTLDLNDNSTLRSLAVTEGPSGPRLFLHFGPLGPGVR